jgi:DNA-binding CsgD family transcriptional regulator
MPFVAVARGWALKARNPPAAGAEFLKSSAALEPMPAYAAQLAYDALRAGAPSGAVAERLRGLAGRTDAPLVACWTEHARAAASGDGVAVLRAADAFAALGARRYALEAATGAAALLAAAGRQDSARRAAARARELGVPGEGFDAPAIDGLDDADLALTRRERQLVDLASQGLSNADIADRLILSVRTVESHLYRAMHKLGVSDRRDL